MARSLSPCGTLSAYRRHLAHGEEPCRACRKANRDIRREERRPAARRTPAPTPATHPPRPAALTLAPDLLAAITAEAPTAQSDLELSRRVLVEAIAAAATDDPGRLPALTRELRETWRAISGLPREVALEDEFEAARRRRAERREQQLDN